MSTSETWDSRILIVAPHQDDETIAAGGLMARLKRRRESEQGGSRPCPHVLVISQRLADQKLQHEFGTVTDYQQYSGAVRAGEFELASRELGFSFTQCSFPLHKLDSVPRELVVAEIEQAIRDLRPTVVITLPAGYDQDHEAVHKAVMAACRPHSYGGNVLLGETHAGQISPTFYVGLDESELALKLRAFALYKTQHGVPEHLFSVESIKVLAELRGRDIFRTAAEAYQVVRWVA